MSSRTSIVLLKCLEFVMWFYEQPKYKGFVDRGSEAAYLGRGILAMPLKPIQFHI